MAFLATQNNRGGLHVQDTDTLEHAEVESAAEAQEWFAAMNQRKQEAWAAQFAAPVAAAPPAFTPAAAKSLSVFDPTLESEMTPQAAQAAAAGLAAVQAIAPQPPATPPAGPSIDYGALAAAIMAEQAAQRAAVDANAPVPGAVEAPAVAVPRGN